METFFSAVLGDLLSRSISFVIDRYRWQQQGVEESLQRLHRLLLRLQSIVEEADGRRITNQAMLRQLRMARDAMYRGYYFHDNSRYRIVQPHARDEVSDHTSLDLSPLSPLKRFCFSTRTRGIVPDVLEKEKLQKILGRLESIASDMQEFVVFVSSYPRVNRQPYCSYLFLENCMFGRQAEQERVINFLLEPHPPGDKGVSVLPIIGPGKVGKSTLVEHVCHDERVRKHFSTIVFYRGDSIEGTKDLTPLADSGVIKHRNHASTEQSLLIVELVDDMDEGTWRRTLHNLRRDHNTRVGKSKIIITSRSNKIAAFGTTESLELDFLPKEAYWYFFKTMAFGSTNPEEDPKLASIGMEIAALVNGCFLATNIICRTLRSNLNARFWYRFLGRWRRLAEIYLRLLGEHPGDIFTSKSGITYVCMPGNQCVAARYSLYQESSAHMSDVATISASDLLTGNVNPQGMYDLLEWQSSIPPYYSYGAHFELLSQQPQPALARGREAPASDDDLGVGDGCSRALEDLGATGRNKIETPRWQRLTGYSDPVMLGFPGLLLGLGVRRHRLKSIDDLGAARRCTSGRRRRRGDE
ncbi:hypothetical protein GUJ93_ZPchr0007g6126 [Zizania palustris]|uniref:Disease resistance N-terminal domain-containing protein n=1 Tax=Zizania palustris TaxID=103762 RepID=A0A8J5T2Q6_ZIZPA|nr:hypothetical protein GUJ93_ZPchr0007g6126 [Zizania palustris]